MPTVRIPAPLRAFAGGQKQVKVAGQNVREAMADLIRQYPSLEPHLYAGDGNLRPFVNVFVGENNVRDLQGVETSLDANSNLLLLPSIAGGAGSRDLKVIHGTRAPLRSPCHRPE